VAERALNTKLHIYEHSEHTSVKIVRASAHYYLPTKIAGHVTMVGELLQFPRLPAKSLRSLQQQGAGQWTNDCDASDCQGLVTPGVLAKRYKLPDQTDATVAGNEMAVAEFQGQFFKKSDLDAFGKACHRDVKVDKNVGDEQPESGIESELDIEYIKAVAPEIPLTVVYSEQFSLLDWANQVNSMKDAPSVHSVSYGNDEKQQTSTEYMFTCNTAFMKAGAQGISVLFASGDQGVCGREGCGFISKRFKPDFPAASPYITAVGGTNFEGDDIGDESAWNNGGGGFSDTFDIPAYQAAAVAAYKKSPDANLPPQRMWNNTGRGYPDVAALGGQKTPYCVYVQGAFQGVAGTSASAPVVGGVFAKLNGLRASKGKPPLGFLNPFIYKNPSGFQDVMSGVNNAGGSYGFQAVKGWDAATGFGTPDYEKLSDIVTAMSDKKAAEAAVVVV
jgi:tripeptidyl-peptidase-1